VDTGSIYETVAYTGLATGLATGLYTQATAASVNITWSGTTMNNGSPAAVITSFNAVGGGGSRSCTLLLMGVGC
jgi:hypothetical protein